MADADVKVLFMPSGRRGFFPRGTPLLEAARSLGVDIDSVCGGRGLCGRCQISCVTGSFAKHQIESDVDHLSPFSKTEEKFVERKGPLKDGRRLSCHTTLLDDAVIDVPAESQVHRQIVRKEMEARDIHLDTATRLYYVQIAEPSLEDPRGEVQLLLEALERDWGVAGVALAHSQLPALQAALKREDRGITVAVYQEERITAIWPSLFERPRGNAIDVGSTTVAAHLCDLNTGEVLASAGVMNPQIRYGEDLMSRVSYVMMHPEGAELLTSAIREAINGLFAELSTQADGEVADILEIALVANPIMHHIVLGINPVNLGTAPFALTTSDAVDTRAEVAGLQALAEGCMFCLRFIAVHVGADAAGVILAEAPDRGDDMTLVVDVGTNAEIVLANKQRLLVCSSPTGPAFEGAQISSGQRATMGAIERVTVDRDTLEPRFKCIGSELWSDEPGFAEAMKSTGVTGICGSGIIEVVAEMYLAGVISTDGVVDGALSERNARIRQEGRTWSYVLHRAATPEESDVVITQNDVRQIQLAKAALYAGIRLLMDEMGVTSVDKIRLAGAFGSHISVSHAMVLGLIPDCDLDHVTSAGNAAGVGARIALLDRKARLEIAETIRKAERIETAVAADFQAHFVGAMALPHQSDPFPNLFARVAPPAEKMTAQADTGRRRRRRTP
ncbi:MAG: ASKHA domain-containing protein [Halieaceae bacterium]